MTKILESNLSKDNKALFGINSDYKNEYITKSFTTYKFNHKQNKNRYDHIVNL